MIFRFWRWLWGVQAGALAALPDAFESWAGMLVRASCLSWSVSVGGRMVAVGPSKGGGRSDCTLAAVYFAHAHLLASGNWVTSSLQLRDRLMMRLYLLETCGLQAVADMYILQQSLLEHLLACCMPVAIFC